MAQINLVSYDLKGIKESFANWVSNLSPEDTPFTSSIGKEAITNKLFQWQTDRLAGTDASNAVIEGSDVGDSPFTGGTTLHKSNTQILRKVVKVSDTANSLANYGRGKELQYQMEKAGREIKRDLEAIHLSKTQTPSAGATGSNVNPNTGAQPSPSHFGPRMDVFLTLIAGLNVSDPDTGAVVHKETPALTEAALFDLTYQLYLAGACPTVIMYHPKHAQFFSSLMEAQGSGKNRVRMFDGASDTKVSTYVSEIVDPLGCRFTLIPNRFAEEDIIYIYDARDFTQMVLRPFTRTQLAKTGSNEKWMIEAECGLRLRNPFAAGALEIHGTTAPTGLTITGPGVSAGAVTLSSTTGTVQLGVTATPAGAAKSVTWTSGTSANATVDPTTGLVTGVKAGTSVITATSTVDNKITATVTVTVPAAPTPTLKTIKLSGTDVAGSGTAWTLKPATLKADGTGTAAQVDIEVLTDSGAALPANSAITVTGADVSKLAAISVTGTGAKRSFTVNGKTGTTAGDVVLTVTAGTAAPVTLTVTLV